MKVTNFFINLTSEDPERLKGFYRNVVGLAPNTDMGDSAFHAGGATIGIDGHSDTRGSAKEPQRLLIDFFVDDLKTEQERLEGLGVKFIRKAGGIPRKDAHLGGAVDADLRAGGNIDIIADT